MSNELEFRLTLYPTPILRKRAKEVGAFDDALKATVESMYALMFESRGVGLAAPQVGLDQRILVLNDAGDADKPEQNLTLINPTIVAREGDKTLHEEGCLSFPGIYGEIERPDRCTVEAFDVDGNPMRREFEGFVSRIIQHEYDHLEGILLVDRLSPADKLRNRHALQELVDNFRAARA
ncbi:MAG: peptide deformylase [Planctomycetes bacterium]|nr:peptide deformylase [Planctomycetota bacterium]MCB9909654.1 peptide deformylase [Planctomycetota bacterium]MCB9911857.1 peptide deformylase [Planctomycetota bacterium]HPF15752.1 peptide deformylase [Planctomycetota bacterium]